MKAVRFAGRGIDHVLRRGANRLRLARHLVATHHVAVLRLGVDDARVTQVGDRHEPVAAKNLEPVIVEDAATHARRAGSTPIVIVLHTAAHVVRRLHVEAHMVEQSDRHVGNERPRTTHVVRRGEPAVIAKDHMIRVLRIDPDPVHIIMRHECGIGFERASAIHRQVKTDASHVEAIGIYRIDTQLAEVHRAGIEVALLGPRRTTIARLVEPRHAGHHTTRRWCGRCGLHAFGGNHRPRCARCRSFHRGVYDICALTKHIDCNASQRTRREAGAGHLAPRVATVGRFPQRTAGAPAVHATGGTTTLIRRREQDVRIGRRHHQVVRAGFVVDLEHLLPARAAVCRFVHTALTTWAEQRTGRRHQHHVVIGRMHDDAIDVLRLREPHRREGLTAVGRLVNATAPRRALPIVRFAGADPHEIRIGLRHGHITDRDQSLILKERREHRAVAGRLPHAAVSGPDIPDRRVGFVNGEIGNATRHRGRADRPEVQLVEFLRDQRRGWRRLRVGSDRCTQERKRCERDGASVQCPKHEWNQREEGSASPRLQNR